MDILYTIFILPIETVMNVILSNIAIITGYGLGIVILSILVNTTLIPLYNYAERIMKKEQTLQFDMYPAVLEVKQKFSGEEGFYRLKAIYKRHNYHPIKSLRSTFGLAIQIPFFISAYIMLSNYSPLQGVGFLFIENLGDKDGLLWGINMMPFVMTGINIISGLFYTNSKQQREQLFIMSALFLVLLYNSPAGLLLYWTCNNIFYLVKKFIGTKN